MEMSWIQRHAMAVLLRGESTRLKDMCPDGVAANLFSYHLDGLMADKYVVKTGRGLYSLSEKGLKLAGTLSTQTLRVTENIKTVIMLYGERSGEILLFRWSRQPYLGKVTIPYDRMAFGTSLNDGIESALIDKLGEHRPVEFMTSVLVKIVHHGECVSHMNALVYRVNIDDMKFPYKSRNGEAFLGDGETEDVIDGLPQLLIALKAAHVPFESLWAY